MVDSEWGVLQDSNTIWIGHHLGFRTGGLAAGLDFGVVAAVELENRAFRVLYLSRLLWAFPRQTEWFPARGCREPLKFSRQGPQRP